jgi:hypothetical protein
MSLVLQSSGGGSVTLEEPVTASNFTITVPASTATMAIDGPAFSAYLSATQNISSNTWTKVACNTEEFDTASAYDNATNYRFTPQVAGYYQVSGRIHQAGSSITNCDIAIYKNGSAFKSGGFATLSAGATTSDFGSTISTLVYLNGSTDYIEMYGLITVSVSASRFYAASAVNTYFQATMVRGA